jgi:hypothetical protein
VQDGVLQARGLRILRANLCGLGRSSDQVPDANGACHPADDLLGSKAGDCETAQVAASEGEQTMSAPYGYQDVELHGRDGSLLGRARVPNQPLLPEIICWKNRYFRLLTVSTIYVEAHCYLVPLEDLYVRGEPRGQTAAKKGK